MTKTATTGSKLKCIFKGQMDPGDKSDGRFTWERWSAILGRYRMYGQRTDWRNPAWKGDFTHLLNIGTAGGKYGFHTLK